MDGNYYMVKNDIIMTIATPDALPGQATPDNSLPELQKLPDTAAKVGFDINVVSIDLDGTGEKLWLVGIQGGEVVAVSVDDPSVACEMTSSTDAVPDGGAYGAALSFDGDLFYSANDG